MKIIDENIVFHLKENVYDENVEYVFEWVDNTVEHSLQFGNSLDGLQWPKDSQHPKWLDGAQILTSRTSPVYNIKLVNITVTFIALKYYYINQTLMFITLNLLTLN